MAQALLISDHEILNDIYALNLKVYVDTTITIKSNPEEALQLLELNPSFDIVISLSKIQDKDVASLVLQKLKEIDSESPLVVIGEKSSVSNTQDVVTLPANFNIQNFVQTVAKILGITAKDMMSKQVPDYYPIPIKMFNNFIKTPCDVFYKVSKSAVNSEFIKILEPGDVVAGKVKPYLEKGVKTLYIPSDFRLKFVNSASLSVLDQLDNKDLTPEEKIDITEQGFEVVAQTLSLEGKVSEAVVDISKKCIENVNMAAKGVPKLKSLLASMVANKTGFLYMHSIMATYVSNHIIKEISWGAAEHADKVSFVLFFHDLFLTPIFAKYPHFRSEEELVFSDELNEKEKEVVVNHARLAAEAVKSFPKCPMGADAIILQHHGMTSGVGFAIEFKDDVSPLAKVIIISEAFVSQIISAKEKGTFDKAAIITELREKFTRHTYKKIIDCLETISL
ncbi:MAG: hypothetical protein GY909_13090 [Oligoflexia bacterium]|nr:hypothetical protein [Oligoflexia bacterium]